MRLRAVCDVEKTKDRLSTVCSTGLQNPQGQRETYMKAVDAKAACIVQLQKPPSQHLKKHWTDGKECSIPQNQPYRTALEPKICY